MWQIAPYTYQLYENKDIFSENVHLFAVKIFLNNKTGEVKLFSKLFVEELGEKEFLDKLNNKKR